MFVFFSACRVCVCVCVCVFVLISMYNLDVWVQNQRSSSLSFIISRDTYLLFWRPMQDRIHSLFLAVQQHAL